METLPVKAVTTDFQPLVDFLTIEGYTPHEFAELFDELAFDYAQTVLALQAADITPKFAVHEKSDVFLFILKELRDALLKCRF